MARGNHGQDIFKDDPDRRRFLEALGEACEKTGWAVHAYVLMRNHYHLLLETPEANLVAGMKWLQGTYTQRYNSRHKLRGHLFQGRYKAVVVDGEEEPYFQVVSTYIHLNPARAKLIQLGKDRLKAYPWSSYPMYLRGRAPDWLERRRVMGSLGLKLGDARGYESYIEGRVLELASKAGREEFDEEWKSLRRGWYVGDGEFGEALAARLEKALKRRRQESHSGAAKEAHGEAEAEKRLKRALDYLGLTSEDLKDLPRAAAQKAVIASWLRERTTVSLRWVSERLGMGHYTRVTQAISRMKHRPARKHDKLRRHLSRLE
jgi:REP element-mobilizing transposase RayT